MLACYLQRGRLQQATLEDFTFEQGRSIYLLVQIVYLQLSVLKEGV